MPPLGSFLAPRKYPYSETEHCYNIGAVVSCCLSAAGVVGRATPGESKGLEWCGAVVRQGTGKAEVVGALEASFGVSPTVSPGLWGAGGERGRATSSTEAMCNLNHVCDLTS